MKSLKYTFWRRISWKFPVDCKTQHGRAGDYDEHAEPTQSWTEELGYQRNDRRCGGLTCHDQAIIFAGMSEN